MQWRAPHHFSVSLLLLCFPPAVWLAPIKLPLQAAQLPNTFKSHKIQQSTNPYRAKTLIWRLQHGHAENLDGDKAALDRVWWMNGRSCRWFTSQSGVQEAPKGMLGERGSLLGLGSKQFSLFMSSSATAGEKFGQNLTLGDKRTVPNRFQAGKDWDKMQWKFTVF